jgi:hypothetical protein
VNAEQVAALRALLPGWAGQAAGFARSLRRSARSGLLLVGTPAYEPWHLAAHLDEECRYAGLPALAPTLVRWSPPLGARPHLSVGLDRLEAARRGESLLVVAPDGAPVPLLERVHDARHLGATIFALDRGDAELDELAHDALAVPALPVPAPFDAAQHLVSAAIAPARAPGIRARLGRLLDAVSGPAGPSARLGA